jgi:acyl-CoA dehydrogenase
MSLYTVSKLISLLLQDAHFHPQTVEWEAAGDVPVTVFKKFAEGNMLIPNLPCPLPVEQLKAAGITELPGGLKVEDFDYLHMSIYADEVSPTTYR